MLSPSRLTGRRWLSVGLLGKSRSSVSFPFQPALILKQHPLHIQVALNCKEGSSLVLTFNYMTFFKVITANIKLEPNPDLPSGEGLSGGRVGGREGRQEKGGCRAEMNACLQYQ
jgi:hypothetical protein